MSVMALLLPLVISFVAAGLYALVAGAWAWRSFVAMWVFGFVLLIGPVVIHA